MTYILQAATAMVMMAALAAGGFAVSTGNVFFAVINAFLFAVNLMLFIRQGQIRRRL